jgi:hypothetical protein
MTKVDREACANLLNLWVSMWPAPAQRLGGGRFAAVWVASGSARNAAMVARGPERGMLGRVRS